jgi:hypothetical protein
MEVKHARPTGFPCFREPLLGQRRHPGVQIVNDDPREIVAAVKAKPGRDIWLCGGASDPPPAFHTSGPQRLG